MLEAVRAGLSDRYEVGAELGRGGMAVVYAAHDRRHNRPVAVKVLLPDVAALLGVERFLREIETTAQLSHPLIVPVFDSGVIDLHGGRTPYFVMPLLRGASLRQHLTEAGRLPPEEALGYARDVGHALAWAHAQGVIHRDVKPENILLGAGHALLTDFGIAKLARPERGASLTGIGMVVGTPDYMAPEQWAGDGGIEPRSDQYALAAVLHEMLTGRTPAAGTAPLPGRMGEVIRKALSPRPEDRYATMDEFLAALETPRLVPRLGRWPARAWLAAVGVVVLALAGILWLRVRPGPGGDGRIGVALMPFRTIGERAGGWGEALPDLLATTLSGTPGLRVPDPWSLWRGLRPDQSDPARPPGLSEAEGLARRVGADRLIMGSLAQAGERLELAVSIYVLGGDEPLATFTLSEPAEHATTLARRAAVELMQRLAPEGRVARGSLVPVTGSPEALKAWLAAREALRRGLVDSADAAITRALALDTLFPLALVDAVTIRTWAQSNRGVPFQGLRALVDRGLPLAESLPERQRLRLQGMDASVATDGPRAAAAFRRLIELDSTDVEAWNWLSYVTLVYGWMFGVNPAEALEVADRALALDSTYMPALFRRAQLSPMLDDPADALRQMARLRPQQAASPVLRASLRGLEALLADDSAYARMEDSLAQAALVEWSGVVRRLRAWRPGRALTLVQRVRAHAAPGQSFSQAAGMEAGLLAAVGRYRVLDSIRSAGTWAAAPGLETQSDWRIVANGLLGLGDPALTEAAVARMTAAWPRDSALAWLDRTAVWQAGWLLAAWHASLGDEREARAWLDVMRQYPSRGSPREWAAALRADVEGRLAERAGRRDSAAVHIRRAFELWTIHTENISDLGPEPAIRFRLAEAVAAQGLLDSAAVLFASLTPPGAWMGAVTTRALYELGLIAERQGDGARALGYFDHALRYWELGGPEVAEWRTRAREGVRRNAAGR